MTTAGLTHAAHVWGNDSKTCDNQSRNLPMPTKPTVRKALTEND
jgi:hypothetical protein